MEKITRSEKLFHEKNYPWLLNSADENQLDKSSFTKCTRKKDRSVN